MKIVGLAALVSGVYSLLVAAEETLPLWAQYGIPGLVILGLLYTKTIVAGWTYREVVEQWSVRLNEKQAELVEVKADNKLLTQQLIEGQQAALPALQDATSVLQQTLPLLKDAQRIRDVGRREGS